MKPDDGGPAFPLPLTSWVDGNNSAQIVDAGDRCVGGMSLRDYFAAQAMAKDSNRPYSIWQWIRSCFGLPSTIATLDDALVAENAYRRADAMLAARKEAKK